MLDSRTSVQTPSVYNRSWFSSFIPQRARIDGFHTDIFGSPVIKAVSLYCSHLLQVRSRGYSASDNLECDMSTWIVQRNFDIDSAKLVFANIDRNISVGDRPGKDLIREEKAIATGQQQQPNKTGERVAHTRPTAHIRINVASTAVDRHLGPEWAIPQEQTEAAFLYAITF